MSSSAVDIILAIMTIMVPLVGGVITVFLFYRRDDEKEPREVVVKTFLWGLLAGAIIIAVTVPMFFAVAYVVNGLSSEWKIMLVMISAVLVQAIFEEFLKWFFLSRKCMCLIGEVDGLFDGFLY